MLRVPTPASVWAVCRSLAGSEHSVSFCFLSIGSGALTPLHSVSERMVMITTTMFTELFSVTPCPSVKTSLAGPRLVRCPLPSCKSGSRLSPTSPGCTWHVIVFFPFSTRLKWQFTVSGDYNLWVKAILFPLCIYQGSICCWDCSRIYTPSICVSIGADGAVGGFRWKVVPLCL